MQTSPIVGAWEVNAPGAPFPWHVMTFTADGTMSQSNPPAGNRDESDSSGHGVWATRVEAADPGACSVVDAEFVEFKARRGTGEYLGRGVVVLELNVAEGRFTGVAEAYRYDVAGTLVAGPLPTSVTGRRIVLGAGAHRPEK